MKEMFSGSAPRINSMFPTKMVPDPK